jgi:hypothetical protein
MLLTNRGKCNPSKPPKSGRSRVFFEDTAAKVSMEPAQDAPINNSARYRFFANRSAAIPKSLRAIADEVI